MRACPSQRAYEVCLCSVPGVVTADQGYNLPIYILLSVVTLDGCISSRVTPTRHSVTPVERTRDPPSAVLAVRGPGSYRYMRWNHGSGTHRRGCVNNARYRSTEILV